MFDVFSVSGSDAIDKAVMLEDAFSRRSNCELPLITSLLHKRTGAEDTYWLPGQVDHQLVLR